MGVFSPYYGKLLSNYINMEEEFIECGTCKKEAGSLYFCSSCLINRTTINLLNDRVKKLRCKLNILREILEL